MQTKDGRVFKTRLNIRTTQNSAKESEEIITMTKRGDRGMSKMNRLCAGHADGISDMFQQNTRQKYHRDPVKDKERARKINMMYRNTLIGE